MYISSGTFYKFYFQKVGASVEDKLPYKAL